MSNTITQKQKSRLSLHFRQPDWSAEAHDHEVIFLVEYELNTSSMKALNTKPPLKLF